MSRKARAVVRNIAPDYKYSDLNIAKLIRVIMLHGKMSIAEGIVYHAIDNGAKFSAVDPIEFLNQVMRNVTPSVEVRSRRIGGATYKIPVDTKPRRARFLCMSMIHRGAIMRKDKSMKERLLHEMMDAYNNKGNAVKMREEKFKEAEANKAFAHFRV